MDSKVSNVHIHGAKDSIQNEVNTEEASPSHVDSTAPLNAASPSALQTITQAGDKSLRMQGVEPSTQVNAVVGSAKDSSIPSSNSPVMPLHSSAMTVSPTNWPANTPTGNKTTNLSNSNQQTHLTPQKENISDSKGNNLSTNIQTPSTSGSHDMLTTSAMKATPPTNYTPEAVNFSSPSTPIDSSSLGSFNQFPVNPEKTTPGQPTSPNNAAKAKPFVCTVCNQTFSRQHNLKSHALTHSQEKPFQCEICHHFFRRHHDLKRHAKLHTGEKPYQCQHCKRSFARLDALNRHLRAESFCGGPQKKLYQGTESKLEQQPPPLQLSPQQTTPQPQLLSAQSQPQSKPQFQVQGDVTTKSQNQQPDLKTNTPTTPQQMVQPQQFKQNKEEHQNKQSPNSSTSPQVKNDISRQPQDFYKRPQIIQEQYHPWQIQTQQSTPIQSISSPNTQSLQAKPVLSISNSTTHHQIVFPVETPTSIPNNSPASHYQMQYTHSQSDFNVQVQESQRRAVPEALMSNEQDIDGRIPSKREMQLLERNTYLEERVRELENEVINERKSRSRREFLESRVNELEIEKKLLKQLLLERDTNGSSEISQNHEKKRKATSPIEPTNSKHQKDGERIIIQQ